MSAGQPTKYRREFCLMLIQHMEKGFSFESFAADIDCGSETMYGWARVHTEFSQAKKIGHEKGRKQLETIGMMGMKGDKGKKNEAGAHQMPNFNPASWIFTMKNRFEWKDKVEHSGLIQTKPDKDIIAEKIKNGDAETLAALAVLAKNQANEPKDP